MQGSRPPPSQRLNPLAAAKGQKFLCELTGKPASIVVNYFGVTYYYSDRSTLELDWNGIKHKIAQLLVPLRQPPAVIPSVEERERQEANVRKSKLALIDLCRMEATKFLVHGDFELSIPGAVQALRYSLDVYGAGKIELVPSYLLLAEANLGLGRHKMAEEYLSLANWSILKNPDCSNRTKSQLYRNFGKLYASQGKHDEALRQLANDVYFSSLQVGPEHIETAGGYYYLATVFYLQRRVDCALAMCDKVVDIWLKHVAGLIDPSKAEAAGAQEPLGESQLMDGLQTLTKIVALREESLGADHITTGEALYTVSLVYVYAKDNERALQLMDKAYNIYYWELGPDSVRTMEVAASIRLAGGVPQAPAGERPQRVEESVSEETAEHHRSAAADELAQPPAAAAAAQGAESGGGEVGGEAGAAEAEAEMSMAALKIQKRARIKNDKARVERLRAEGALPGQQRIKMIEEWGSAVFKQFDANSDGKLSKQELAGALKALPKTKPKKALPGAKYQSVEEMIAAMDDDADGSVDEAEWLVNLKECPGLAGALAESVQAAGTAVTAEEIAAVGSVLGAEGAEGEEGAEGAEGAEQPADAGELGADAAGGAADEGVPAAAEQAEEEAAEAAVEAAPVDEQGDAAQDVVAEGDAGAAPGGADEAAAAAAEQENGGAEGGAPAE